MKRVKFINNENDWLEKKKKKKRKKLGLSLIYLQSLEFMISETQIDEICSFTSYIQSVRY